jgi:hypothetical protein
VVAATGTGEAAEDELTASAPAEELTAADAAPAVDVERVDAEVKNVLAGESYDETVIGAGDAGTRQLIAAELLAALAARTVERRERARAAFVKHDYLTEATRQLRTADAPAERAAAARSLGYVQDKAMTPHLTAALDDKSPEVRRAAVESLAELHDPHAIPALKSLLKRERDRKVSRSLIKRAIEASAVVVKAETEDATAVAEAPALQTEAVAVEEPPVVEGAPSVTEDETQTLETEAPTLETEAPAVSVDQPTAAALADVSAADVVPGVVAGAAFPLITDEADTEAEEVARREAEAEEARRRAEEEEARVRAEAEARAKAEEEARVAAEAAAAEARAEEERQRAEAEAARLKAEEEERERAAEAERQAEAERKAEEERRRAEEEARLKAEQEAEAERQRAEAEARALAEEQARAEDKARADEQASAEEQARLRAEEEALLKAEAEDARLKAEEEARLKAEAEERAAAEARARAEEEERARAEEEARVRAEEEAARLRAEEEGRRRAEEERQRVAAEARAEEERRLAEEARIREEEAARLKAEEEAAAARQLAEQEELRRIEEERLRLEEEARQRAEAEAARLRAEEEAARRQEEEARRLAEVEAQRLAAEEEARLAAEAEARARAEEEEARRLAAEEAAATLSAEAISPVELEVEEQPAQAEASSFVQPVEPLIERNGEVASGWVDIDVSDTEAAHSADPIAQILAGDEETQETLTAEPVEASVHVSKELEPAGYVAVEEPAALPLSRETDSAVTERGIAEFDEFSSVPGSILKRLGSEEPNDRAAAVSDLARVGGDDSFREISAAFDDPAVEVRNAAARSLFNLNTDRAATFTRALRESPPERRRKIGAALASSGLASEAIGQLMGESREKTYDAFSLLFLMSKAGEVQPLMRAIEEHPNNEVRLAVVKLLALSGQQEILPAFRRLAVRGSLPTEVRSAVMEAIYQISSQSPTPA